MNLAPYLVQLQNHADEPVIDMHIVSDMSEVQPPSTCRLPIDIDIPSSFDFVWDRHRQRMQCTAR